MESKIIHILNRGVNNCKIFQDDIDRDRFIKCLYKFNNETKSIRTKNVNKIFKSEQSKTIEILKWVLLPNHYHLLIKENTEGGAVDFIKRLSNGYTKYFNIRHERNGYLFQGRTKLLYITNDKHFLYIPFYIDLNVLEAIGIKKFDNNSEKLIKRYRWSSLYDYYSTRERIYSKIINTKLFYETFNTNPTAYLEELKEMSVKIRNMNIYGDL